ncbi:hypothetical protein [Marinobacterium arenosum]|nr:hypothetical protein [Marinobacterium arenosum]MBY4677210.1 hypothetical protein [Marinobacterium arenosum]
MDKYAMISFIPSIAVIGALFVIVAVGIKMLRKFIAEDAATAARKDS